jgi:hypothetical protein
MGRYLPPVTRMTLPSRLPMSREGSNFLPILKCVIESLRSGSMKPKPSSNAVERSSKIWRRMERADSKNVVVRAGAVVEDVII